MAQVGVKGPHMAVQETTEQQGRVVKRQRELTPMAMWA